MSITIELTPEEEILLRDAAHKSGMERTLFAKEAVIRTARNVAPSEERTLADTIAYFNRMGEEASRDARAELHAKGLPIVYAKDGKIWEETPDGANRIYPF